jgi:tetratricopeptide (TPR) repeat protein
MNFRHSSSLVGISLISIVASVPAKAQEGDDLGTLVTNGLTAMNAEKWPEALALHTQAVERFGKNQPLQLFGPQFGVIYYRKGICELKLQMWEDAAKSFETCYRDFPNDGPVPGGGNVYQKRALLKWGEAAMGKEEWALAIRQFKKFLEERDPTRDTFPQGAFYVQMAICHYKLEKIAEGNENLEIAIKNKLVFPTPEAGIVAGFQALVGAVIASEKEQALLDFIEKNRGDLIIEPFEMQEFSRVFMRLAGSAVEADMKRAALALYQMVPSTEVALQDARIRLASLGGRAGIRDGHRSVVKAKLEPMVSALQSELRGPGASEIIKLAATAFVHEQAGNVRGAFAAYEQLELFHPKAEKREDYLYNLVRTGSLVGAVLAAERYGQTFLKDFPNSQHVPAVRRMMLSSLFYEGEYETCIEVASVMINELESGSKEHDICLHVLGGSYYYTGQYDKAMPLLDEHVEKYPESTMALAAQYFQAANTSKLQYWSAAARLLDAFFEKYPDPAENIFFPFALLDRATCHYAEDENDQALEKLARLESEFPSTAVMEMAYNLKGNVLQTKGLAEESESAYLQALELAERRENELVAGEALYYLVALLGEKTSGKEENPRIKDAVPHADKFWKEHGNTSPFRAQVAVAQVYALDSVGRGEEALGRLQDVIAEMATTGEGLGLEEAINSYTAIYLERKTPAELREHFNNFPKIRFSDRAARALLHIAVITVFEDEEKKATDPAAKREAAAVVQVLFSELRRDFAPADLSSYILVKVGDYLRTNTANPREALPYYDEVISRTDQSYRFAALFGRGDVYARSTAAADLDRGIEDFKRVFADSQDVAERETALFRTAEAQFAKGDYAAAADTVRVYLDRENHNFRKFTAQAGMLLARTFDERKMVNDAIAMYMNVWTSHMGFIEISAPAMQRWMELSWQRNRPADEAKRVMSDRQAAYEKGAEYLSLTGRFKDKMSEAEVAAWNKVQALTETYVADPGVKSLEELAREKAANRR